jgi:hypothetical protein
LQEQNGVLMKQDELWANAHLWYPPQSDMSICGLLFQWASTIKISLTMLV